MITLNQKSEIQYILPPLSKKSLDLNKFPLLAENQAVPVLSRGDVVYPHCIKNLAGTNIPLFTGGIVSEEEIDQIAAGTADIIHSRHTGKEILLITILEGAQPFANLVAQHLENHHKTKNIKIEYGSIKVSSYCKGTVSRQHEVIKPLTGRDTNLITDFKGYDAVIILDDLVDSGDTINWLVNGYFIPFGGVNFEAYFMLEKELQRREESNRTIRQITKVMGRKIPNEWVVGFGLDISLPRSQPGQDAHLFRGELPGGIYAFNHRIEKHLLKAFKEESRFITEQLKVYVSDK